MTNVIYDHNVFIVPDVLHIMMIIIMPYTSHTVILTKIVQGHMQTSRNYVQERRKCKRLHAGARYPVQMYIACCYS